MLTVKATARPKLAVLLLTDPVTATVVEEDRIKVQRVSIDVDGKTIIVQLVRGYLDPNTSTFVPGSASYVVKLDRDATATDPRQRNTWQQVMQSGDVSLATIESVIRQAAFISDVERLPTDP